MHSLRRRVALVFVLLGLCVVAGCYERTVEGDAIIYHFQGSAGILVILAGLVAVPAGWFLRKANARLGIGLMIAGPMLAILLGPTMYSDRVVVDNEHFQARYGFWFAPSIKDVSFADLKQIHQVETRGRRGRVNRSLHCVRNDGSEEVVSVGMLVKYAVDDILTRAQAKNVRISDEGR